MLVKTATSLWSVRRDDVYAGDDPDEMDARDVIGDLDGIEPDRIEPSAVPPDEGDSETERASNSLSTCQLAERLLLDELLGEAA